MQGLSVLLKWEMTVSNTRSRNQAAHSQFRWNVYGWNIRVYESPVQSIGETVVWTCLVKASTSSSQIMQSIFGCHTEQNCVHFTWPLTWLWSLVHIKLDRYIFFNLLFVTLKGKGPDTGDVRWALIGMFVLAASVLRADWQLIFEYNC